jgi:hypothetical protein
MLISLQVNQVHVNCLKITDAASVYGRNIPRSNKWAGLMEHNDVHWIGTNVLITGKGNPMKGYQGIIKDVLCGQTTKSRLRIAVQFTHLNPAAPFKTVLVDFDEVVDAK